MKNRLADGKAVCFLSVMRFESFAEHLVGRGNDDKGLGVDGYHQFAQSIQLRSAQRA